MRLKRRSEVDAEICFALGLACISGEKRAHALRLTEEVMHLPADLFWRVLSRTPVLWLNSNPRLLAENFDNVVAWMERTGDEDLQVLELVLNRLDYLAQDQYSHEMSGWPKLLDHVVRLLQNRTSAVETVLPAFPGSIVIESRR